MTVRRMSNEEAQPAIVDDRAGLARGLYFGVAFSLPLWGAVIALAKLVL